MEGNICARNSFNYYMRQDTKISDMIFSSHNGHFRTAMDPRVPLFNSYFSVSWVIGSVPSVPVGKICLIRHA